LNFSRCAEVCKTYVQEAPRKKEKTGSSRVEKKEKKNFACFLSLSLSFLPLLASRFGFCIIAMARRLPLLLPLLCLVAAGVAAAAPAAADAGAAAASREVRLVLVQLKKKKKTHSFFQFERRDRCSKNVAFSTCFASSFAPSRRSRRKKAAVSRLAQQTQRTVLSSSSERLVVVFGAAAPAQSSKILLPTRRARALVLGQGRALSIIHPKRAK